MAEQTQVIIRPAAAGDIKALQHLIADHMAYEKAQVRTLPEEALHKALFSTHARLHIAVAAVHEDIAGYLSYTKEYSTWQLAEFIHMDCLFINAAYRNDGLGKQLIQYLADTAKAAGITELQWQTPKWNEAAIRFYERLGATSKTKARFEWQL